METKGRVIDLSEIAGLMGPEGTSEAVAAMTELLQGEGLLRFDGTALHGHGGWVLEDIDDAPWYELEARSYA